MTDFKERAREIVIRGMDPRTKWETEDYRLKELILQALESAYQEGLDAKVPAKVPREYLDLLHELKGHFIARNDSPLACEYAERITELLGTKEQD